jgi:mitochondrial enoyl-[acyl-carrier protein] reductase / trans-2-enoyl-CoA reductase
VKKTLNAAVYETHGLPTDVLRLAEQPWPKAGSGQAIVQMRAAPVNPADLNMIEGKYPVRMPLPAVPGMEGAGTVIEVEAEVENVKEGDLVILPHNLGTWREAVAVDAAKLVVVPNDIDPIQAAMLKINPLTAWRLLHGYVTLRAGDWVIQNAANSAAGRAVIQIAHELGYHTVNVVRRAELIDELKSEGADVVLVENDSLREQIKTATSGAPILLGLNAVGGESALHIANALAPDATMMTYGAMSLQPLRIPNGLLIFKNLNFRGIWINKWYDSATSQEKKEALQPLFEMAQKGLLRTKIEKAYPLREVKAAVAHAMQAKRGGKIVIDFQV